MNNNLNTNPVTPGYPVTPGTPKTPQSLGGVIGRGLHYCKISYTRILPISFIYSLFSLLPSFVYPKNPVHSAVTGEGTDQVAAAATQYQNMGFSGFIMGLIIVSLTFLFYAALFYRLNSITEGRDAGFGASILQGLRKILSMWGLSIVLGIILFIIAVPLMILAATLIAASHQDPNGFIIIVMFLALIPIIWIAIMLYFSFFVLIIRNKGVFASFGESWRLVIGHWWRAAFFVIGTAVLMIICTLIIAIITALIMNNPRLVLATNFIFQIFAWPVVAAILMACFHDLEARLQLKKIS